MYSGRVSSCAYDTANKQCEKLLFGKCIEFDIKNTIDVQPLTSRERLIFLRKCCIRDLIRAPEAGQERIFEITSSRLLIKMVY